MKFSFAWADVISQNVTLKTVSFFLFVTNLLAVGGLAIISQRPPLIIERECLSKIVKPVSNNHPQIEVDAFIRAALSQRFDLGIPMDGDLLSEEEKAFKRQEEKDFESKGMTQRVFVNSMKIDGSKITVDADRLISWGQIRSALIFPLTLTISTVNRNPGNP